MAKGVSLDDVPTGGGSKLRQPADTADLHQYGSKMELIRLIEPLQVYGSHTVQTLKRDKTRTRFTTPCLAWDRETLKIDRTKKCPWCDHMTAFPSEDKENRQVSFSSTAYANGFLRATQKNPPELTEPTRKEAKTGTKDKESDTETIWKVFRLPVSVLNKLKELKQINAVELPDGNTQNFSVLHARYGIDVRISYDKTKSPAQQYSVVPKEGSTPLRKTDMQYLRWDLDDLQELPAYEDAKDDYMRWADRNGQPNAYAKSKKSSKADEYGEDPDDEGEGFDEDEDPPPRKPAGKKPVGKPTTRRPAPPPEDEDEYGDGEDGDGEDPDDLEDDPEPAPRKPAGKKHTGKRPPLDDDFDSEDDPEDALADEDPDDPDDLEEDDPEPPPRRPASKTAAGKRPAREPSTRRPAPPPEDEDLEDNDDDFEDDPEPAPRKPAGRTAAKPATRPVSNKKPRRPEPEDDEDEFAGL